MLKTEIKGKNGKIKLQEITNERLINVHIERDNGVIPVSVDVDPKELFKAISVFI